MLRNKDFSLSFLLGSYYKFWFCYLIGQKNRENLGSGRHSFPYSYLSPDHPQFQQSWTNLCCKNLRKRNSQWPYYCWSCLWLCTIVTSDSVLCRCDYPMTSSWRPQEIPMSSPVSRTQIQLFGALVIIQMPPWLSWPPPSAWLFLPLSRPLKTSQLARVDPVPIWLCAMYVKNVSWHILNPEHISLFFAFPFAAILNLGKFHVIICTDKPTIIRMVYHWNLTGNQGPVHRWMTSLQLLQRSPNIQSALQSQTRW